MPCTNVADSHLSNRYLLSHAWPTLSSDWRGRRYSKQFDFDHRLWQTVPSEWVKRRRLKSVGFHSLQNDCRRLRQQMMYDRRRISGWRSALWRIACCCIAHNRHNYRRRSGIALLTWRWQIFHLIISFRSSHALLPQYRTDGVAARHRRWSAAVGTGASRQVPVDRRSLSVGAGVVTV